jgi:hypothetical protein
VFRAGGCRCADLLEVVGDPGVRPVPVVAWSVRSAGQDVVDELELGLPADERAGHRQHRRRRLRAAFRFGSDSDSLRWMWDHPLDWATPVA